MTEHTVTFPSGETRGLPCVPAADTAVSVDGTVAREFRVGTLERRGLFVEVRLRDAYSDSPALSIVGHTQARSDSDWNQGGQMQDTIRAAMDAGEIRYVNGWTPEHLARLLFVWDLYHLNDLNSGCEHQRAAGWTYGTHQDQRCPVCGYRIGSAWKRAPLPADVVALACAWLSADNPAEVPLP